MGPCSIPVNRKVSPAPRGNPSKTPAKRVLALSAMRVMEMTIPAESTILAISKVR